MPSTRPIGFGVIAASLVLAMALRILPLPQPWFGLNPDWVALFLIFWTMAYPDRVGVATGWVAGLFTDVLTGRMLGQHALAYSVLVFLTLRWYQRLRFLPLPLQCFWVLLLLLVSQILISWTQHMKAPQTAVWSYWWPSLTGALAWPWVLLALRRMRRVLERF